MTQQADVGQTHVKAIDSGIIEAVVAVYESHDAAETAVAEWIIAGLEGAAVVGGVSALSAALVSIGIPKDSTIEYEMTVKAGKYLVVAHGTAHELGAIRDTLGTGSHQFRPASLVAA